MVDMLMLDIGYILVEIHSCRFLIYLGYGVAVLYLECEMWRTQAKTYGRLLWITELLQNSYRESKIQLSYC